jgi:hypothetical protein
MVNEILTAFTTHGIPHTALDDILRRTFDFGVTSPDSMLRRLSQISRHNPNGLQHLLSDLRHPWPEKFIGAEWVLRYLTDQGHVSISSIRAFEESALGGLRRYDVVMNGLKLEFKNIPDFINNTTEIQKFVRQIALDYRNLGSNLSTNMRWIFSPRAGSRAAMIPVMQQALRNAGAAGTHGLNPTSAKAISDVLESIIRVGS